MNKKPIYAALSALIVLSSGCAYTPRAVRNNVSRAGYAASTGISRANRAITGTAMNSYPNINQSLGTSPSGTAGYYRGYNGTPGNTIVSGNGITTYPYYTGTSGNAPRANTGALNPNGLPSANGYTLTRNSLDAGLRNSTTLLDGIYAAAESGNWARCSALNRSLKTGMTSLRSMPGLNTSAGYANAMTSLNSAVNSRNAQGVKKCANQLLKQAWDISGANASNSLSRTVPIKYYAREIMLTNDINAAKKCNSQLVSTWNGLRSSTRNTSIQKCVNSINNCLGRNDLASAQKYCGMLLRQTPVMTNSGVMGL